MQSTSMLWEAKVLGNTFNYFLQHAHLPLSGSTHALRRFTILDPKSRDPAMGSPSGTESDMSVSNASHFAAPDSDDELLVVAMAANSAADFFLNVVTAEEGSRPRNPGGSAKGRARNRNRGREAAEMRLDLDKFRWAHTSGKPVVPNGS
jgi:hypothetical protein